ncbi:MAG: molybdate ABC transporter substrate-binding protein, partial [Burkholderiaceae bacterium]|nr:molybdate ABC transporter substrate-binding protein [Burkholderiaceae bacterium]
RGGQAVARADRARRALCATLAASALAGALGRAGAESAPLVLAASSLKDAIEQAGAEFAGVSGIRPRFSFAASSTLARQLEQGIEADLYFSADLQWMDFALRRGLVDAGSVHSLLGNRLVLVAPKGGQEPIELARGVDLSLALRGGRLALADVRAVPAGRYARAALESLGAWDRVAGSLAMTENVRVALALAARGEVELAIVYATDARVEPRVSIVATFPEDSHPPIRYPVALVRRRRRTGADAFHGFLRTAPAAKVFNHHGFVVLG